MTDQDPFTFQILHPLRQHFIAHGRNLIGNILESFRPAHQRIDDQSVPTLA
ncbi:hypothetical protein D3C81_1832350 [compost metagenome]